MTDLEKFIELYRSFGIECIVEKQTDSQFITLSSGRHDSALTTTVSTKFTGGTDNWTVIEFDKDGKFVLQEFDHYWAN